MLAPSAAAQKPATAAGEDVPLPAAITSAETLAALRAIVSREPSLAVPCTDPLARRFLGWRHRLLTGAVPRPLLRWLVERISPGSYCFTIARTRHFDELLLESVRSGVEQVVLLGAGYDSRAARFAEALRGIAIYEVDHPGTQARKRSLLAPLSTPSAVTYLPVDFTRESFAEALDAAGFDRGKPTFFLWEGVSYYLPRAAVIAVLDHVAAAAPGSSIAFDYALAAFVAGDHSTYGGRAVARWLERIKEPFRFGLVPGETRGFLADRGLELVTDLGPPELERAYLATRTGPLLGRTLGHVRMAHARVPWPVRPEARA
jgi:methyltransferase (TIGR00027 family)